MRKNGFTMVELLVGLIISSLLMLTVLAYFKQISFLGMGASDDSDYETQLEIGLITIQKIAPDAGYGLGATDDVEESTFNGRPAVYWRYADSYVDPNAVGAPAPLISCKGVSTSYALESDKHMHRLLLLESNNCETGALHEATWTATPIVTLKADSSDPVYIFSLRQTSCAPFGIGDAMGYALLQVNAQRKYEYGTGNKNKIRDICLINIKEP
ncbi:MAG: prepilin-type N-terminal cleavage/methylation domain-containing protein [Venatoribacter sp.]